LDFSEERATVRRVVGLIARDENLSWEDATNDAVDIPERHPHFKRYIHVREVLRASAA
jgi:hypothetical protein